MAWSIVNQANASNYIMIAATSGGADSTYNQFHLPNGHAYTLLGCY
jgi:hypothetical protein